MTGLTVVCDVQNPLYGVNGAAHTYARQKGANDDEVELLDRGLRMLNDTFVKHGMIDVSKLPGAGAAGGVGGGMRALFDARLKSGVALISDLVDLDEKIRDADLVITGEGKLDNQSLQGKVVGHVAEIAKEHGKPMVVVCGQDELSLHDKADSGMSNVLSILDRSGSESEAMEQAFAHLTEIGRSLV